MSKETIQDKAVGELVAEAMKLIARARKGSEPALMAHFDRAHDALESVQAIVGPPNPGVARQSGDPPPDPGRK